MSPSERPDTFTSHGDAIFCVADPCLSVNLTVSFLVLFLLGISACGDAGSGEEASNKAVQVRVLPPAEEVLAKVYDGLYQTPKYFFVDERADTPRSYVVYHVKDFSMSYELCTNDYYQALDWETADHDSREVNGYYVGSYENDRYFEFVRELSYPSSVGNINDPTSPGFARVFKCSYLNRNGVDRNIRNGYAGTLNLKALSKEAIRTFTEYMWQFTFFWPAEKKVLETFSTETETAFQHTLMLAFATKQGSGQCDFIDVVDWDFSVNKDNGQINKEFKHLYDMQAQLVNGVPIKCGD